MDSDSALKSLLVDLRKDLAKDAEERHEQLEKRMSKRFNEFHNQNLEHLQEHSKRIDIVTSHIRTLWRTVKGSEPPPPNVDPSIPPPGHGLDDKLSTHDLDIAGIHGNLIAVDSKVKTVVSDVGAVKGEVKELRGELASVREINQKQSDKMAIGKTGSEWLFSPEGLKSSATFIAAITGLVTAAGTFYALMTGRLPMPTTPPPAPMVAPFNAPQGP